MPVEGRLPVTNVLADSNCSPILDDHCENAPSMMSQCTSIQPIDESRKSEAAQTPRKKTAILMNVRAA